MTTRKQVLAPLGTVAVVVGVVVGVTLLSPGDDKHAPKVLQLASGAARPEASTPSGGGGYTLVGTLPSGTPDDAPAWTFDRAAKGRVSRLATALHTTRAALRISSDPSQSWSYSPCGEDTGVASSDGASGCAVAPDAPVQSPLPVGGIGKGTPLPAPPPPVSEDVVVKAAAPVFEALGLDGSKALVDTGPYGGSASLNPTVGGLETVGFLTSVNVDRTGRIQFAGGWLGDPTRGDSYPLISARQAFDGLPALLHPDLCRLPATGEPGGCAARPSPKIIGAHLGLLMQPLKDHGQALVPAWLFTVLDSAYPISQVAVEAKYLAPPSGATDQPQPLPATPVDPVPASTAIGVDRAFRVATTNEVRVQYGDSSSCPWQHVTHQVKEDSSTVYVLLQADPRPTGRPCTDDYLSKDVTLTLQSPLGDRKVVDASTAKAVPVA